MSSENSQAATEESGRISPLQGWLLVFALVALSAVLFMLDSDPPPAVVREMVATAGFVPILQKDNVVMTHPPALGLNTAVFVGSLSTDDEPQLTAINLPSGDLRWQVTGTERSRPDLWPEESAWMWPFEWRWGPLIVVDNLVVATDAIGITTSVHGFDLGTGEAVWQRNIGAINGSDVSYLTQGVDNTVVARVEVEGYSNFQILDAESGWRQYQRQQDAAAIFWVDDEPRRIYEAFANQVRVTGEMDEIVWSASFSGCDARPLMTDDLIYVQTFPCPAEQNRGAPGIVALSREGGQLVWQRNDLIVSNVAMDQDKMVGLTLGAELLVLDRLTGNDLGRLPFSQTLDLESSDRFFVALSEEIIAVYFGDRTELVVIRFQ